MTRRRAGNRETVERLYGQLLAKHYVYTDDPVLVVDQAQRVRDPHELDAFAGTCLDITTTFASMCIDAKVAPLLVIGIDPHGASRPGHAWVLVDLDRDPAALTTADDVALSHNRVGEHELLYHVDDALRGRLRRAERYLALDVSCALAGYRQGQDLDYAIESGTDLLGRYPVVLAVDVLATQAAGLTPCALPERTMRPVISRHLPVAPSFRSLSPERDTALDRIANARGCVVVLGEPGLGKSMLALQAAAHADGGFGWFVGASNERAFIRSLAMAEAHQVGRYVDELSRLDLDDLASSARTRLDESRVPWVVVVDNANCAPSELRKWMPTPKVDCGQLLIITTTNDDWATIDAELVQLHRLRDDDVGCPPVLRAGGRPLFMAAFERLGAHLRMSLEELASLPEVEATQGEAEDVLWAIFRSRFDQAVPAARLAAWMPPDGIELSVLRFLAANAADLEDLPGLVELADHGFARMHRLIGAAIRRESIAADPETTLQQLAALLTSATDLDVETLQTIHAELRGEGSLRTTVPRGETLGVILHALGTRLEPVVGVDAARELMADALTLLPSDDLRRRADCLHAAGRYVFQHRKGQLDQSEEGYAAALEALELRLRAIDEAKASGASPELVKQLQVERWRTEALVGLLEVQIAVIKLRQAADEAPRAQARAAALRGSERIDAALEERLLLGADELDLLRGRFNQAFVAVHMAQVEEGSIEREKWLTLAFDAYRDVGKQRREHRSKPMAQAASCDAGQALVQYLRAVLLEDIDDRERLEHLRSASEYLALALRIRESLEQIDGPEVAKTARLEAKIAFARFLLGLPGRRPAQLGDLLAEMWTEPRLWESCGELPRLPKNTLSELLSSMWLEGRHIEEWSVGQAE